MLQVFFPKCGFTSDCVPLQPLSKVCESAPGRWIPRLWTGMLSTSGGCFRVLPPLPAAWSNLSPLPTPALTHRLPGT